MSADLRPHPGVQEVMWVYRPVVASLTGGGLQVTNRRSFTDLSDLVATWEVIADGAVSSSGDLDIGQVPPRATVEIPLPCDVPDAAADVHLTVRWAQRRATPWAPKGHLVAWDQVTLHPPEKCAQVRRQRNGAHTFRRVSEVARVELSLFRAPVDNDGFKLFPRLARGQDGGDGLGHWVDAGIDRLSPDDLVEHDHQVEPLDDGSEIHTHVVVVPDALDDVARVGVRFELPAGFDRLRWFGRGPLENYPDRNRGAVLGVWESGVDEPPYLVPQEFGLRTDCRWFEFVNRATDVVVRLDVLEPTSMHVSATRFRVEDLYAAGHETDLRPRRGLVVHADVAHRGVGTGSCGPDVLDGYRIRPGTYRFTYRLMTAGF